LASVLLRTQEEELVMKHSDTSTTSSHPKSEGAHDAVAPIDRLWAPVGPPDMANRAQAAEPEDDEEKDDEDEDEDDDEFEDDDEDEAEDGEKEDE
jgi:hypothetical protein